MVTCGHGVDELAQEVDLRAFHQSPPYDVKPTPIRDAGHADQRLPTPWVVTWVQAMLTRGCLPFPFAPDQPVGKFPTLRRRR